MLVKKTGQKLKSLTMVWFEWKKVLSSLGPNVNDFMQEIKKLGFFFFVICATNPAENTPYPSPG